MTTFALDITLPSVARVQISEETLSVDLSDGRTISVPLGWYPRLEVASAKERANWRVIGNGEGIHWEDLDEDLSIEGLVAGWPSRESRTSFQRWLDSRKKR